VGQEILVADAGGVAAEELAEAGRGLGDCEERTGTRQEGDDPEEELRRDRGQRGRAALAGARDLHDMKVNLENWWTE
jgi:hypothetical protein